MCEICGDESITGKIITEVIKTDWNIDYDEFMIDFRLSNQAMHVMLSWLSKSKNKDTKSIYDDLNEQMME